MALGWSFLSFIFANNSVFPAKPKTAYPHSWLDMTDAAPRFPFLITMMNY
jgi:hypothetical protein